MIIDYFLRLSLHREHSTTSYTYDMHTLYICEVVISDVCTVRLLNNRTSFLTYIASFVRIIIS